MTGLALIYDKSGVDRTYATAAYKQIKNLIDDRFYRVEYFSNAPCAMNDTWSNPLPLFIIPGGNYSQMAEELKPLAPRIRQLVMGEGTSYLGIGAGAVAASCHALVIQDNDLLHREAGYWNSLQKPSGQMHLQLYTGYCCHYLVPFGNHCGTQEVRMVSTGKEFRTHPLFFKNGFFFPAVEGEPGASTLLHYASHTFTGQYRLENGQHKIFNGIIPAAAIAQKAGRGSIVLSGLHPEMGPSAVKELPVDSIEELRARDETLEGLSAAEPTQDDTMNDFLQALNIVTKRT